MLGRSHTLAGAAGYSALASPLLERAGQEPLRPGELVAGAIVCARAALLPDLDCETSTDRQLARFRLAGHRSRRAHTLAGGHRAGRHSLLGADTLVLLLGGALELASPPRMLVGLALCALLVSSVLRALTGADAPSARDSRRELRRS